MFSRDVLDSLLPSGEFWEPAADDDYDLLLEGIAENTEAARKDLEDLGNLRNPWKTPVLSDLEKEYALVPSKYATEAERRKRLAALMFAKNTKPTPAVLQEKLRASGFDVYVYQNNPPIDPHAYLNEAFQLTCGDILPSGNDGQCGEPEAFCARTNGELLARGEMYQWTKDYLMSCDDILPSGAETQCGEPDALAGNWSGVMKKSSIEFTVPDDPGYWPLIFFVGGPKVPAANYAVGANLGIQSIAIQADGKIIIGGHFTVYNGSDRIRIARINTDGSLDPIFNPGAGANSVILSMAIQADGKIIISGYFTEYNGTGRNRIARINTDGNLDTTFDPGTGANDRIYATAIQADGKILIGGYFTSYNGTGRNGIARINTDGSLDATFDPGTGIVGMISDIKIQTDGKIIIAGNFNEYNGTTRWRIARINTDGSLDLTFDPGLGANAIIEAAVIQTDGKILIGGNFTTYNGTGRNRIARVNSDGSLDATFDPGTGCNNEVNAIAIQTDGKILIGGNFTTYNGTGRNRITRINTDGSLDILFDPGIGTNDEIHSLVAHPDGIIVIGGDFIYYNAIPRNRIACIFADGSLDDNFNFAETITTANIPIERRQEFHRIILQYKPLHTWAGLIVNYS